MFNYIWICGNRMYLGIPVINATLDHPHINYNFNINPKNLNDYKKIINNLKN